MSSIAFKGVHSLITINTVTSYAAFRDLRFFIPRNFREAFQKKKNQNVNFFQIGPDPPPLEIWTGIFEDKNFQQILTCLRTLHTSFTNFDILTMYLVASDFVKTKSILKFYFIFYLSKIQFRQCELWGWPPPPFGKSSHFEFFFYPSLFFFFLTLPLWTFARISRGVVSGAASRTELPCHLRGVYQYQGWSYHQVGLLPTGLPRLNDLRKGLHSASWMTITWGVSTKSANVVTAAPSTETVNDHCHQL